MWKVPTKSAALPAPTVCSANPSASLPTLWGYVVPALDHIVHSPTSTPEKAPAIDLAYCMGIHTAIYNHITAVPDIPTSLSAPPSGKKQQMDSMGTSLYLLLDKYFADLALEVLVGVPEDDTALIQYLNTSFKRYAVGVHSINCLFACVNKHYVKRAIDNDSGWLRLSNMLDTVAESIQKGHMREQIMQRLKEKHADELKRWGYEVGGPAEKLAEVELCAEAASSLDHVVSLEALVLRRFRTEVVEPLLAAPR